MGFETTSIDAIGVENESRFLALSFDAREFRFDDSDSIETTRKREDTHLSAAIDYSLPVSECIRAFAGAGYVDKEAFSEAVSTITDLDTAMRGQIKTDSSVWKHLGVTFGVVEAQDDFFEEPTDEGFEKIVGLQQEVVVKAPLPS
ncbi:MAG: hypothetical protein GDA49_07870 [Rhodospirillales bacterium]|nr:hypothetical protein [Rhodospirillales bacterium]